MTNILEMKQKEVWKKYLLHGRFPFYCTHLRSMATYHLESKYLHMMGYLYKQDFFGGQ